MFTQWPEWYKCVYLEVVVCDNENFYRDCRELFHFEVNFKFVFNVEISFKIKHFQNLFMKLFNDDSPVHKLERKFPCWAASGLGDPQDHVSLCKQMIKGFIFA